MARFATLTERDERFRAETLPAGGCTCENATSPYAALDCPVHGEDAAAEAYAEQRYEIEAENAWLRHAEAKTDEDYAFERYENELGLI